MLIEKNIPLKSLTTFGINVDAKYFAEVASLEDISTALEFANKQEIPVLVLGGGSNVLFTKSFEGLIVKVNFLGIEKIDEDKSHVYVKAFAGENWDHFVEHCVDNSYGGLENLSLIPGNVGASPIQNIGAYGVEIKDYFQELAFYSSEQNFIQIFNGTDCRFGYRNSIFKQELKGKGIILSVTYRLDKNHKFNTDYVALKEELSKIRTENISIKLIRDTVIKIRRSKLPDPAEIGNAGSFFKNPTVNHADHTLLKEQYPKMVSFPQPDGSFKLAAGWLVEQCGWKGRRAGDAGVHEKQALVLVNYGDASGSEILKLADQIQASVWEKFGVSLEKEVNIY